MMPLPALPSGDFQPATSGAPRAQERAPRGDGGFKAGADVAASRCDAPRDTRELRECAEAEDTAGKSAEPSEVPFAAMLQSIVATPKPPVAPPVALNFEIEASPELGEVEAAVFADRACAELSEGRARSAAPALAAAELSVLAQTPKGLQETWQPLALDDAATQTRAPKASLSTSAVQPQAPATTKGFKASEGSAAIHPASPEPTLPEAKIEAAVSERAQVLPGETAEKHAVLPAKMASDRDDAQLEMEISSDGRAAETRSLRDASSVREARSTARPTLHAAAEQIGEASRQAWTQGRKSIELELKPPGLGLVRLKLSGEFTPNGAQGLRIEIHAAQPEARQWFSAHASELRDGLAAWDVRLQRLAEPAQSTPEQSWKRQEGQHSQGREDGQGSRQRQGRGDERAERFRDLLD
ncbi:MAG: flagellar hook-length control protein FliK [Planctomycetes bacterium]|nr:flagellar hook-length control protein FliK [Planctomycetota bacterium]